MADNPSGTPHVTSSKPVFHSWVDRQQQELFAMANPFD
jgi:hypothetical protein